MSNRTDRPTEADIYEGATRLGYILAMIVAAALIFIFVVAAGNAPAHAAKPPVYKGTVTIVVSPTTKSDPYGQYLNTKLWNLPAAAKAAHIGKYRIVSTKYANEAYGDIYVRSITKQTRPASIYKLTDCYKGRCEIWESQVTMSDKIGAAMTPAQRQAALVAALKSATPR